MARYLFGGGIADYVVADDNGVLLLSAGTEVTFWNAATGGTRYTDLRDLSDTPINSVTSDEHGAIPQLRGPDGVRSMWADASGGSGPRRLMIAADLPDDVASLLERVAQLESLLAAHQTLLNYALYGIKYDSGTASYPSIPPELAGQQYLVWIGPPTPTGARARDLHIDTVE
ncbi:hypothetical protein [uncultured Thermomonospora sp.]|uniref:hypothetical protein n=1 Tax=uncultured Thermomonospora sp. TaxID=671175 RepID=UPI00259BDE78|nr:hypothetical protein [uncultured Thermomonospora sp.]